MIVDDTFIRMVEKMKNVAVWHEEVLIIALVKQKEEMESITRYLKKIKHFFFKM